MGKYHRLLAGVVILFLRGCGELVITPIGTAQDYFEVTVLEVKEHTLLVEPLEGEEERKSSDRISVGTDSISQEEALAALGEIRKGDVIEIGYDGMIMESYPAQITGVFAIEFIEE